MNETASVEQIQTWIALAQDADDHRLTDVRAMDIYNINLPKGQFHIGHRPEIGLLMIVQ